MYYPVCTIIGRSRRKSSEEVVEEGRGPKVLKSKNPKVSVSKVPRVHLVLTLITLFIFLL